MGIRACSDTGVSAGEMIEIFRCGVGMEGGQSGDWINMFPSPIDQPAIDHHLTSNSQRWHRVIQTAIATAIAAAEILDSSMSDTGTRRKNARWDKDIEVFKMMEFLARNASKAGDGGNFPATWYTQAAEHIAAFRSPDGNTKTGDQVETKYKFVFL